MTADLLVPSRRRDAGPRRPGLSVLTAAFCVLLLGLAGCKADAELKSFTISGLDTLPDQTLAKAISRYYTAEAAGKWSTLYSLRHPDFRRNVSRDTFIKAMRRDWTGWHFNGVVVEGLQGISGEGVNVSLVFDEVVMSQDAAMKHKIIWFPRPWWDDNPRIGTKTRSFASWARANGRWYPVLSGLRGHIAYDLQSLN